VNRIKVVFLSSIFGPLAGGGEISTKLLFNELRHAGHDVYIITTRKQSSFDGCITLNHLDAIPLKLLVPGTPITDLILAKYINEKLREIKPDVIHIHDPFTLPASILANRKLRVPCVYTCRSAVLPHPTRSVTARGHAVNAMFEIRNRVGIRYLQNVDAVISISEFIKRELITVGVDSRKVQTIYNIPSNLIKNIQLKPPSQIKKKPEITLFSAGRLDLDKGFDTVVKAMSIIHKKNPDIDILLIIAGNGPEMRNLKKAIITYQLESFVMLTGWVCHDEVMRFYANSDIVFLPSVYPDSFGRGSIEAISFGKPVVASDIGGISEAVVDGVNGFLVPAGDVDALAEAVLRLVKDRCLRERMGQAGREILGKRFSSEEIVRKTIKLYEEVIRAHTQRPRNI